MSNDIQLHERSTAITAYEPQNIGELRQFAQEVCATQLVPTAYKGKPADAMVAMMYGKETANLGPLASLQYVAVINGRPAFYGDALPGIAFNKGLIVDMEETLEGEPMSPTWTAVCTVKRASGSKVTQRFSVADATRAGLWKKAGPWTQYPQRMLQWRARSWAIRDAAPHMLFGPTYEELRDADEPYGPEHARDVTPTADQRRAAMAAVDVAAETVDPETGEVLEAAAPEPAPATNGGGKSAKERAREIAAALRGAPTADALRKLYARLSEDVSRLPEAARMKVAEIYDEVLSELPAPPEQSTFLAPEPAAAEKVLERATEYDDLEDPEWAERAAERRQEWAGASQEPAA